MGVALDPSLRSRMTGVGLCKGLDVTSPAGEFSAFRIQLSAFSFPHSAFCIPLSAFRFRHSAFGLNCQLLEASIPVRE